MEKILIFIKHHFKILWKIIEWANGIVYRVLYKSTMEKVLPLVFEEMTSPPFSFRRLSLADAEAVSNLIKSQKPSDLEYFKPHDFELISIKKQYKNRSFLMMGAFDGDKLVGYFFLRFFVNRKCFVGRLIDVEFRGKGVGSVMNKIMYETAWRMNFHCLSTISRNNTAVMQAHAKNSSMIVLKELQNEYLLVEFVKQGQNQGAEN